MTILAFFEQTARVQGSPIISFRCELFALISAIHMIEGDETLVSDCASVLLRANVLQTRNYQWDCIFKFEKPDLRELFLLVARAHSGNIKFAKVKSHTCMPHVACLQ